MTITIIILIWSRMCYSQVKVFSDAESVLCFPFKVIQCLRFIRTTKKLPIVKKYDLTSKNGERTCPIDCMYRVSKWLDSLIIGEKIFLQNIQDNAYERVIGWIQVIIVLAWIALAINVGAWHNCKARA